MARFRELSCSVEGRQVQEVVASIFHTLLFHRTFGKFHYKQEGSYSVGTVGFEDVTCDFVDFTYVRCSSDELHRNISKEIKSFSEALRNQEGPYSGQISLEFFQKKQRSRWSFLGESSPWEVWILKINVISLSNEHERQIYREKVGDMLADRILSIATEMNKHEYVPKMPSQSELDLVFDTSYSEIQPYLFRITYETSGPTNPSVGTAVRKIIREALAH